MLLLSKGLDFKIATENISVIDIKCDIKESVRSFCKKALENEFGFVCKTISKQGRKKNVIGKLCNGFQSKSNVCY